jgi:hypothetical protein
MLNNYTQIQVETNDVLPIWKTLLSHVYKFRIKDMWLQLISTYIHIEASNGPLHIVEPF